MIEAYSFGSIAVDGRVYTRDIQMIENTVIPDWRRKSGHRVEVEDIADLLKAQPGILVIGKGDPGRMEVGPGLKAFLTEKKIELIEVPTAKAVQIFNRLTKEKRKAAAGFHLTC